MTLLVLVPFESPTETLKNSVAHTSRYVAALERQSILRHGVKSFDTNECIGLNKKISPIKFIDCVEFFFKLA